MFLMANIRYVETCDAVSAFLQALMIFLGEKFADTKNGGIFAQWLQMCYKLKVA